MTLLFSNIIHGTDSDSQSQQGLPIIPTVKAGRTTVWSRSIRQFYSINKSEYKSAVNTEDQYIMFELRIDCKSDIGNKYLERLK